MIFENYLIIYTSTRVTHWTKLPQLFSLSPQSFWTSVPENAIYNGERSARSPHDHHPPSNPLQYNWRCQWTFGHSRQCRIISKVSESFADIDPLGQISQIQRDRLLDSTRWLREIGAGARSSRYGTSHLFLATGVD